MMLTDLKADLERLKADLMCEVLTTQNTDFEGARVVRNAAVTRQPLLLVLPENTQDVVKTVQFAQQHTLPLSVRGIVQFLT